jgi:cysteine desulfurase
MRNGCFGPERSAHNTAHDPGHRMIYLDHHATTPPAPAVIAAMGEVLAQTWANPSSPHAAGQQAKRVLATARAQVAQTLGCKATEVIFTSGATESNHLALHGLLAAARAADPIRRRLVMSCVEHAGLLRLARALAAQDTPANTPVSFIPVLPDGQLDMAAAAQLIAQPDVAVVSLMAANNETGVLMPVAEVAALAQSAGARLHVDATQLIGKLPFDFARSGADALSFSAHKLHGPKGVGVLLLRQGVPFATPTPGSQERGRRGGTENLPGIVGLATALTLLGDIPAEAARQAALRDALEQGLAAALPATHVWCAKVPRLPGISYLRLGELSADVVLQRLERLGVAAASGAACSSGGSQASHVLSAMGVPEDQALAAVRLSLGRSTSAADIQHLLTELPPLLAPLLQAAPNAPAPPAAPTPAARATA